MKKVLIVLLIMVVLVSNLSLISVQAQTDDLKSQEVEKETMIEGSGDKQQGLNGIEDQIEESRLNSNVTNEEPSEKLEDVRSYESSMMPKKRYIVKLKKPSEKKSFVFSDTLRNYEIERQMNALETSVMELSDLEVNQLLNTDNVQSIEYDKEIETAGNYSIRNFSVSSDRQSIPWGNYSIGSHLVDIQSNQIRKKIKVAIFDTGIANHPDLSVTGGVSFLDNKDSYIDDDGHGTHMAGTIAALDNTFGVQGVNPNSEIYSVRVLDQEGKGFTSYVIKGIEWAIENDINVINMSFVSEEYSEMLHDAIKTASKKNILIIGSAGNAGYGEDTIMYPAKYPEVIAVGAVNSAHSKTSFSSTGLELDIVAPGEDVLSTGKNGGYGVLSGTSSSAAYVTGAASLIWSMNPTWDASQVKNHLLDTATPLGKSNEYGSGLVNVAKALGIVSGSISPLTEKTDYDNHIIYDPVTEGGTSKASYDYVGKIQSIVAGESATVSLKLEGDQNGNNNHSKINIIVYRKSNPSDILATHTVNNPVLHQKIAFTWQTSSATLPGDYVIHYQYPARPSGIYDDKFTITVTAEPDLLDTYEINDSKEMSKNINLGNSYVSYISSTSDVDFYRLDSDITGNVDISFIVPNGKNYNVTVYNEMDDIIYNSNRVTTQFKLNIVEGQRYYFKISGQNNDYGREPYTLILGGIDYPVNLNPTGVVATPSSNSIKLSWDEMEQAQSYKVQINGQNTKIVNDTTYIFEDLEPLTTYSVGVSAVYDSSESDFSTVTSTTKIIELILFSPTELKSKQGLFLFKPATTGVYKIFTSILEKDEDTILEIYSDKELKNLLAENDDYQDTTFSEISRSFTGGSSYYVKVKGYGDYNINTRLTAEVVKSNIPYLQEDIPVDINEKVQDSNIYLFIPKETGIYNISTNYYGGNYKANKNDTEIEIFADTELSERIGYNDDKSDSEFSLVSMELNKGKPYYIRVNGVGEADIYARLLVSRTPIIYKTLELRKALDSSLNVDQSDYFQFKPSQTGRYRFFTYGHLGKRENQDTVLQIYSDESRRNLVASNDDVKGPKPYGGSFSKIEINLQAGVNYYIVLSGYDSLAVRSRIVVEDAFHSTKETAIPLEWGEIKEFEPSGTVLRTNSLYDVDYFRIKLEKSEQIFINLLKGSGSIEDSKSNLYGLFSANGDKVRFLEQGEYYLKVGRNLVDASADVGDYQISLWINEIKYGKESENFGRIAASASMGSTSFSFDPTPFDYETEYVEMKYKNRINTSDLQLEIFPTVNNYATIYKKSLGSRTKGSTTTFRWEGDVTENRQLYANSHSTGYSVSYWAKNGFYQAMIYPKGRRDLAQIFLIVVANNPLNQVNWLPAPPEDFYDGKSGQRVEVTSKNKDKCEACYSYYVRYIFTGDDVNPLTGYDSWSKAMYGLNGLERFWEFAESSLLLQPNEDPLDYIHRSLDKTSMIPILSSVSEFGNGLIYLVQGNYLEALTAGANMIPVVGTFNKGKKQIAGLAKFKRTVGGCFCFASGTPIKTKEGFKSIEDIKVGDLVLSKNEETGSIDYKPVTQLFQKEIEEIYTLYVEDQQIKVTGNHPFYVKDQGWKFTNELIIGDLLETSDNNYLPIKTIEVSNNREKVYNFTVDEYHTFYVTELGIWTHNHTCSLTIDDYKNLPSKVKNIKTKSKQDSVILGEQLELAGVAKPEAKGWAAHHLVPVTETYQSAKNLREKMEKYKIDLNSAANGVWLPTGSQIPNGSKTAQILVDKDTYVTWASHKGRHGAQYFDYVWARIQNLNSESEILHALNEVRKDLMSEKLVLGKIN
ncbi:S8 family serine peptidase [Paenibacillus polysaccharolyticus]|uniref:S8 family serine peptidase n=1 Tax=Paenibacillus polysaccharolyticus TaxID=582692 RepID=UPI0020400B20|nr:S8 family serine peptidase [Paenibacillus polysaccharolyticus]MCM3133648.1 S8 family serine peptidase [Paenibacillus polysaccharolyticus]